MQLISNNVYIACVVANNKTAIEQFVSSALLVLPVVIYRSKGNSFGWFCQAAVELERSCGQTKLTGTDFCNINE